MQRFLRKASPPSDDKRWRIVEGTMRRNGHQTHALIEALHTVQEAFGFLDEEGLKFVAASLRVPLSKVYGVATFYHFFSLKPHGKHSCVVCTGTACYINGSGELTQAISRAAEVRPGETTADGQVSLLTARCLGSCSLAPAVVFDGEVAGKVSAQEAVERVRRWMRDDA